MAWSLRLLPLLVLPLLASSAGVAGCGNSDCTQMGCAPSLEMVFDETIPRDYTVTVTVGSRVSTADCTVASQPDTSGEVAVALENAPENTEGRVVCGTDRIVLPMAPASLKVRLDHAGGTATEVEAQPAYEVFYPNGEECDPTCQRGSIAIDVGGGSGA